MLPCVGATREVDEVKILNGLNPCIDSYRKLNAVAMINTIEIIVIKKVLLELKWVRNPPLKGLSINFSDSEAARKVIKNSNMRTAQDKECPTMIAGITNNGQCHRYKE